MAGVMDQMPLGVLIYHVMTVIMVTVLKHVAVKMIHLVMMNAAYQMVTTHPALIVLVLQMVMPNLITAVNVKVAMKPMTVMMVVMMAA
jgi:trans-aconitate methyltransferase